MSLITQGDIPGQCFTPSQPHNGFAAGSVFESQVCQLCTLRNLQEIAGANENTLLKVISNKGADSQTAQNLEFARFWQRTLVGGDDRFE